MVINMKMISKEETLQAIRDYFCVTCKKNGNDWNGVICRECKVDDCLDIVDSMEVKHDNG